MLSSDREKTKNIIPNLPVEVIFKILLHLPIEFLWDCARYVCKAWLSIIHSPSFIEAYVLKSEPGLLIHGAFEQYGSYSLYVVNGVIKVKPLRYSFQGIPLDSCRGLCLFLSIDQQHSRLYVVNPTTKQIQALPSLGDGTYMWSHLLYISQSDKYKVVCCFNSGILNWFVFTLGADTSWRTLNVGVLSLEEAVYPTTSVTVGPFLYFSECKRVIVAVNVHDGTVSSILIPDDFAYRRFHLLQMGDTVCCVKLKGAVVYTSVLRNIGESEWIEDSEYIITARDKHCYDFCPVGWLENGQVFVTQFRPSNSGCNSLVVLHFPETGNETAVAICRNPPFYNVVWHTNSLVRW